MNTIRADVFSGPEGGNGEMIQLVRNSNGQGGEVTKGKIYEVKGNRIMEKYKKRSSLDPSTK